MQSKPAGPANRRAEHLKDARAALERWRFRTVLDHYSLTSVTAAAILPDKILTALASNARIKTVEDMGEMLTPCWMLASRHGQEVVDLLKRSDAAYLAERESKKQEKELRQQETAKRRAENC